MTSHRKHTPPTPEYISVTEACRRLGVSRTTIDRRFADGTIERYRFGRRVLIDWAEVLRVLKAAS